MHSEFETLCAQRPRCVALLTAVLLHLLLLQPAPLPRAALALSPGLPPSPASQQPQRSARTPPLLHRQAHRQALRQCKQHMHCGLRSQLSGGWTDLSAAARRMRSTGAYAGPTAGAAGVRCFHVGYGFAGAFGMACRSCVLSGGDEGCYPCRFD